MPGFCLCAAPGFGPDAELMYTLYPNGFLLGSNTNPREIFRAPSGGRGLSGTEPLGGPGAFVRGGGPVAKIDFFLDDAMIGEHLTDYRSPSRVSGYLANANFTSRSGPGSSHRRGVGNYLIVSRPIAEQLLSAIGADGAMPSSGLSSDAGEWAELVDTIRGSDSDVGGWLSALQAAARGSMNYCAIAYLVFRP